MNHRPSPFAKGAGHMGVFKEFVVHHWYFAFPMFAMSLFALALVLWRLLLDKIHRTPTLTLFYRQPPSRAGQGGYQRRHSLLQHATRTDPSQALRGRVEN